MRSIYDKLQSILVEGADPKSYLGRDDFVEVFHRNVRLAFHLRHPQMDLARLIGTIRRIEAKLQAHLALAMGTIEVEVYRSRQEWLQRHTLMQAGDATSWIQGDSGRVIRVFVDPASESFAKLQLMVTHECVHRALACTCGAGLPAWLDEGLAVYLSQELPAAYRQRLKEAAAADALLPLDLLADSFASMDRRLKTLAYAQSASLVGYLQATFGWQLLRDIIAALGRGDALDTPLNAHGLTLYLLERQWQRTVI